MSNEEESKALGDGERLRREAIRIEFGVDNRNRLSYFAEAVVSGTEQFSFDFVVQFDEVSATVFRPHFVEVETAEQYTVTENGKPNR